MMKKIIMIIGVVILSLVGTLTVGRPAAAVDLSVEKGTCGDTSENFLFMRPWYYSLKCNGNTIDQEQFSSDNIGDTVKKIALVIIDDILRIVGVLAAGFLIYGGLQYAYSGGDASKASKGKRTIQAAIIGMVISLIGQLVVNTFEKLTGAKVESMGITIGTVSDSLNLLRVSPEQLLGTIVNFVLGVATLVAVGFIIYSGVNMITAYGNVEKVTKSKRGIMYSVAGLIVALLAFAIVNFALDGLSMAMPDGGDTDLFSLVNTIFGWIVGVSGFLAVAGIVVGGVQYTVSTGDAQKTQKAKNTVMYSIIGLVVALVAGAVISFVIKAVFGS